MSAEDRMDMRLRRAGERWQRANADVVTVDLTALDGDVAHVPITPDQPASVRRAWRPRAWIAAVAGVAAVGVAVLVGVSLNHTSGGRARPADGASALVGRTWQLVTGAHGPAGDTKAVLAIGAGGNLSGSDGCNFISGTVTIRGSELVIGDLISTAMACLDTHGNAVGEDVTSVLTGTVQWSIEGETLTLTKPGTGTLTYRPVALPKPTTDPKALIGLDWSLSSIEDGTGPDGTASSSSDYAKAVLNFDSGGHLTGNDTCNAFSGDATISAGRVVFHGLGGTFVACANGTDKQVLAVLSGPVTWSITAGQLTITKSGVGSLTYDRVVTSRGSGTGGPAATATASTATH